MCKSEDDCPYLELSDGTCGALANKPVVGGVQLPDHTTTGVC